MTDSEQKPTLPLLPDDPEDFGRSTRLVPISKNPGNQEKHMVDLLNKAKELGQLGTDTARHMLATLVDTLRPGKKAPPPPEKLPEEE